MPNNEWGDFQTPPALADQVVKSLPRRDWTRILEPTCGTGNFLRASLAMTAAERIGIEVQPEYAAAAAGQGFPVLERNIFELDLSRDIPWSTTGELLVVGNPPWVTNSQLGRIGSINLPTKTNLRKLRGLDAMTGASNFDIAEHIVLKLMLELQSQVCTIAVLVKTQVARNVLSYAHQFGLPYSRFTIKSIDARSHFNAAVDACLLSFEYAERPRYTCEVFDSLEHAAPSREIGFVGGLFVADVSGYTRSSEADGRSPIEWRSGVKHDASGVMEMSTERALELSLESDYVFPLLKCTDIFRGRLEPARSMIVPQRSLGEDTSSLAAAAPRLWSYLTENSSTLDGRRSSIYRGRPRFSVFGLGEYTFAPYKIAISGLHKQIRFVIVGPYRGKPVVFDDTCYLVAFQDGREAAMCLAILHSDPVSDLLDALIFRDSKRPVSKKLLQRIDVQAAARLTDRSELESRASAIACELGLPQNAGRTWPEVLDGLRTAWSSSAPQQAVTVRDCPMSK